MLHLLKMCLQYHLFKDFLIYTCVQIMLFQKLLTPPYLKRHKIKTSRMVRRIPLLSCTICLDVCTDLFFFFVICKYTAKMEIIQVISISVSWKRGYEQFLEQPLVKIMPCIPAHASDFLELKQIMENETNQMLENECKLFKLCHKKTNYCLVF